MTKQHAAIATPRGRGAAMTFGSAAVPRRGEDVPCGCAGTRQASVSGTTLARGATISLARLALLTPRRGDEESLPPFLRCAAIVGGGLPVILDLLGQRRDKSLARALRAQQAADIENSLNVLQHAPEHFPRTVSAGWWVRREAAV